MNLCTKPSLNEQRATNSSPRGIRILFSSGTRFNCRCPPRLFLFPGCLCLCPPHAHLSSKPFPFPFPSPAGLQPRYSPYCVYMAITTSTMYCTVPKILITITFNLHPLAQSFLPSPLIFYRVLLCTASTAIRAAHPRNQVPARPQASPKRLTGKLVCAVPLQLSALAHPITNLPPFAVRCSYTCLTTALFLFDAIRSVVREYVAAYGCEVRSTSISEDPLFNFLFYEGNKSIDRNKSTRARAMFYKGCWSPVSYLFYRHKSHAQH